MLIQFNLLAKSNSGMIFKDRAAVAKQEVSKQAGPFESRFQQQEDAFDKALSDARKLLESAETRQLTHSETFMVNTYIKIILYSYLILKKMNERITDSKYINKYT